MKKPIIIKITGFTNGVPDMKNKGDVDCKPGDTIKWMIDEKKVGTIKAIRYKSGDYVFDSGPCPKGSSGNWEGVISNSANGTEEYTIVAAPPSPAMQAMPYDPHIKVSPGGGGSLNPENNPK